MLNKIAIVFRDTCTAPIPTTCSYRSTSFHFLRIFFNYAYYLGMSPFRIKQTYEGLILHSNRFQMACCLVVYLWTTTFAFIGAYISWPSTKIISTPWLIFDIGMILTLQFLIPAFAISVWRRKSNWAQIFHLVHNFADFQNGHQPPGYNKLSFWTWKKSAATHLLCVLVPLVGLYVAIGITPTLQELVPGEFKMLCVLYERVGNGFFNGLVLCIVVLSLLSAFTLAHLSFEFEVELLSTELQEQDVISRQYLLMKEIMQNLNSAISSVCVVQIIAGVLYYPSSIILILNDGKWVSKSVGIVAALFQAMTYLTAAEATERFNKFKERLITRQKYNCGDWTDASRILQYLQICDTPICLCCGPLFTFTYSSIGSGLGLMATYGIISLQLYAASSTIPAASSIFSANNEL